LAAGCCAVEVEGDDTDGEDTEGVDREGLPVVANPDEGVAAAEFEDRARRTPRMAAWRTYR
jgi:hypothetical protein